MYYSGVGVIPIDVGLVQPGEFIWFRNFSMSVSLKTEKHGVRKICTLYGPIDICGYACYHSHHPSRFDLGLHVSGSICWDIRNVKLSSKCCPNFDLELDWFRSVHSMLIVAVEILTWIETYRYITDSHRVNITGNLDNYCTWLEVPRLFIQCITI